MDLTTRERVITSVLTQEVCFGDKIVVLVSRDAPASSKVYVLAKVAKVLGYFPEVMPYEGLTPQTGKNCLVDAIKKYYSHRLVEPRFFLGAKGEEGSPVRLFRVENGSIFMLNQRKRIWEVVS